MSFSLPARARPAAVAAVCGLISLGSPAVVPAQSSAAATDSVAAESGWNAPEVLELVQRAQARRAEPKADGDLHDYAALAEGYVYFYLDRRGSDQRTLIKVDQVAVEVYWAAPDLTKQRIVGMRDASYLPNRQHYHLDHLTVVQDEFGDLIRMGDGDEVSAVPHPAAPGSEDVYDFRLADSLTLRLPGTPEPIRVYEIEVRPRDLGRPGIIGSMFVDRARADIVRLAFTFTPASYVDPRLDYIRVSLENGLWNDRHWLPYEQRVEIRRQMPEFDLPYGAVIQGVLRVGEYEFNQGLPFTLFAGARVTAVHPETRAAFPFREGLTAGIETLGLAPPPSLEVVRRRALELAGRRYLSGLPRLRLHVPNTSAAVRYDRAEGLYLGAGLSYAVHERARIALLAGQATSLGGPTVDAGFTYETPGGIRLTAGAFHNRLDDIGPIPGAPGVLNSLAALITASDYLDPYLAEGVRVGITLPVGDAWRADFALTRERHESARIVRSGILRDRGEAFRPIRPVAEGRIHEANAAFRRVDQEVSLWSGGLELTVGRMDGEAYARPILEIGRSHRSYTGGVNGDVRLLLGTTLGTPPPQRIFLLGGRATVPGYEYRSFAGRSFGLVQGEFWRPVVPNLVDLRAVAAAGWTELGDYALPAGWDAGTTRGIRASAGLGVGLFFDMIRLDVVRGFGHGGRWEAVLSVNPSIDDIL